MRTLPSIAQFGLGPIGRETARLAHERGYPLLGAVDIDPRLAGGSLADVLQIPALAEAPVCANFAELLQRGRPDLVLHTSVSSALESFAQLRPVAARGCAIISSCEELVYPGYRFPEETRAFDQLCRECGARLVASGVNPGFLMDLLPLCLTSVQRSIGQIRVRRVVNASTRRQPLQRKIGSGQDPAAFLALYRAGRAGHAGFEESARLLAHGLGWPIERLVTDLRPVVAERPVRTAHFHVEPGQVRGLHQTLEAWQGTQLRIRFDLVMALDEPEPRDEIQLDGEPNLHLVFAGGVDGDRATHAALVNTIPRLMDAVPGFRLLTDLPLPRAAGAS